MKHDTGPFKLMNQVSSLSEMQGENQGTSWFNLSRNKLSPSWDSQFAYIQVQYNEKCSK